MLEREQFNEIRLTSVGKDEEKVKVRVKEIWLPLRKPQREEILTLSGLTIHAVMRSYQKGKLSLKLALAMAQSLKINPYYLSGASEDRDEFSDEIISKFLNDNGHAALAEGKAKPRRKYNRKTAGTPDSTNKAAIDVPNTEDETAYMESTEGTPDSVTANESAANIPVPASVNDSSSEATPVMDSMEDKTTKKNMASSPDESTSSLYGSLASAMQEKVSFITASQHEKLETMPLETAEQLLRGLYLRAEYSEEAKNFASLVKFLLLM